MPGSRKNRPILPVNSLQSGYFIPFYRKIRMDYPKLDKTDRELLLALQNDARLTVAQLAEKVALSHSPCWRRIHRLEQEGYISGYHARLERMRLGYGVLGFISIQMENHSIETANGFEQAVLALPEVLSCHNLSGRYDYQIEAIATDLESFSRFVRERLRWQLAGLMQGFFCDTAFRYRVELPL
jgi:Lrp/AsnC family transcriptional regulator, leucine-responsive regulatory protein